MVLPVTVGDLYGADPISTDAGAMAVRHACSAFDLAPPDEDHPEVINQARLVMDSHIRSNDIGPAPYYRHQYVLRFDGVPFAAVMVVTSRTHRRCQVTDGMCYAQALRYLNDLLQLPPASWLASISDIATQPEHWAGADAGEGPTRWRMMDAV